MFMCAIVDEYLAPGLVYLNKYLNLSDGLASVTLLSFANGAGDFFTALMASDSKEGISFNVGSLYGAGLFVLTLVIAMTIRKSPKEIQFKPKIILRNLLVYLLGTLLTIYYAYVGHITTTYASLYLIIYSLLILLVIF